MRMTDDKVRELIETEFREKNLGTTEQYLDIHEPTYSDGKLKIDRICRSEENRVVAYLPVKDEYFFFAVYIDEHSRSIFEVGTESRNDVSLTVTSETLTSEQMGSFTELEPSQKWNKGDLKPTNKTSYKYSYICFTPDNGPDTFENKLKDLFTYLEKDTAGILKLIQNAEAQISITTDHHHGNQFIAGFYIDQESIKKMTAFNLPIRFDIWAWGEPFK